MCKIFHTSKDDVKMILETLDIMKVSIQNDWLTADTKAKANEIEQI